MTMYALIYGCECVCSVSINVQYVGVHICVKTYSVFTCLLLFKTLFHLCVENFKFGFCFQCLQSELSQNSLKITADMLAIHQIFQSSHQAPVCLVEHAVFPQIVLSGVGIAAPRDSWWAESTQLNPSCVPKEPPQSPKQSFIQHRQVCRHAMYCMY